MEIERRYQEILEKELEFKEISVVVGSRQVGKTTLLNNTHLSKKKSKYITFDSISILKTFENNIETFKEQYVDPYDILFIDEIQYSKLSGKHLKYLYDTTGKKFIISGSSTPELSIHSLSYLVGRIRIIEIFPITFKEFVNYKDKSLSILLNSKRKIEELSPLNSQFEQYLQYGGYPNIITYSIDEKENMLKNLVNTYLLKEIKEILQFNDVFEFESVLKQLALQDGQLLNKSSLSQDLGISNSKISKMLTTLNSTYITYQVQPYLKNKIKEQIKSPKLYFQDTGFKNALINNFNELHLRQDKGTILENFILNSLIRKGFKVQFWNYKNRHEIDFVIEKGGNIIGIEVKSKLNNSKVTPSTQEFIKQIKPHKVYIFNESIQTTTKQNKTTVEFDHIFNIIPIIENNELFQ